jgi:hypothetical protein
MRAPLRLKNLAKLNNVSHVWFEREARLRTMMAQVRSFVCVCVSCGGHILKVFLTAKHNCIYGEAWLNKKKRTTTACP